MPFEWAALAFVEKWRLNVCRGHVVEMNCLGEKTRFHLRMQAPEWSSNAPASYADVHLQDVGDILREKRVALLDRAAVIVSPVTERVTKSERRENSFQLLPLSQARHVSGSRRVFDKGSFVVGQVVESDGERYLLIDVGFPIVVRVEDESSLSGVTPDDWVELTVDSLPRGFVLAR